MIYEVNQTLHDISEEQSTIGHPCDDAKWEPCTLQQDVDICIIIYGY